MAKDSFFLTTAIPYSNGAPHIGHAYEAIATDMIARYMRLCGKDVHFLTGMDEHGQKVMQTAKREGITSQQMVDQIAAKFKSMQANLSIVPDDFIRTTDARHKVGAQALWQKMAEKGDIYLSKYSGWYSVRDEAYYQEDELTIDQHGKKLAPTGTAVEWVEEESYFFRLSAYTDRLLKLYEEQPNFLLPSSRRNEIISFVKSGLKDLSVSRTTFDWGIPVPQASKHVMYVWVDALSNYITALGYPNINSGNFAQYWPCNLHVIGKDIIRFHAVYWPAFLMAADLALPKTIFAHGFIYNRGEKMSKSLGNVITPESLANEYGSDALRYFLLREIAFGQDGTFSHEAIVNRTNADLANDLGNLAQRSLSMINKNCNGAVPHCGPLAEADQELLKQVENLPSKLNELMQRYELHVIVTSIWAVVADANRYFADSAPWGLKKTDPDRMATVLYVTAEVLRMLAILVQPIVPLASAKLLDQLAINPEQRTFAQLGEKGRLKSGTPLPAPFGVFPRYVEKEAGIEE